MSVVLHGIPTCGTVRKARRWLADQGIDHAFVDLRETPPDAARIDAWIARLGAKALRNTSGRAYRALPATRTDWDDARWARAFADDPMLLKRPIIERDGVAVKVGFRGDDATLLAELGG